MGIIRANKKKAKAVTGLPSSFASLEDLDISTVEEQKDFYEVSSSVSNSGLPSGFTDIEGIDISSVAEASIIDTSSDDGTTTETDNTTVVTRPTISGCENGSQLGNTIPLIMGKTYYAPKYIGRPYTTISGTDGETETFHCLYLLGFRNIKVQNIKLGIDELSANDGVTSGVSQTSTEVDTVEIEDGFPYLNYGSATKFSKSKYAPKLEIRQGKNNSRTDGEVGLYPQKVVETKYNAKLLFPQTEDGEADFQNCLRVYAFSSKYAEKVELQIQLDGLYAKDSDGQDSDAECEVACQVSFNAGETWEDSGISFSTSDTDLTITTSTKSITFPSESAISTTVTKFKGNKKKTLRYVGSTSGVDKYNWSKAKTTKNHVIYFRVFRVNTDSVDSNTVNAVTLTKVRTWCYNYKDSESADTFKKQAPMIEKYRDRTARLGIEMITTREIEGTFKKLNCMLTSKCRTWNSTTKTWSTELSATNNPSSIALMVMQGEHRGSSEYRYPDSKLDLSSFGEFYEWCEKRIYIDGEQYDDYPQYQCNGALLKATKTSDIVNTILSCGHASLIQSGKKYKVIIDKPRTSDGTTSGTLKPKLIINAQNIIAEPTNSKSYNDLPDGYQAKFVNALVDSQDDTMNIIFTDAEESEAVLEPVEVPYITDPMRVKRYCNYHYACVKYRPELWSRSISLEGHNLEVGDLVGIQDDSIDVGLGEGAEITKVLYSGNNIIGFETDGTFDVTDKTKSYGVEINKVAGSDGNFYTTVLPLEVSITETGVYHKFTLKTPLAKTSSLIPEVGDVLSFGLYNNVVTYGLVVNKSDNGSAGFDLSIVPYQNAIYDSEEEVSVDDYVSNVTLPQTVAETSIEYATVEDVHQQTATIKGEKGDKGDTGTARILDSLVDSGTENEVAIYDHRVYVYSSGRWVLQNTDNYIGKKNTIPEDAVIGQYFLAGQDIILQDYLLSANGSVLTANGLMLEVKRMLYKNEIYEIVDGGLHHIENHSDFRYIIAMQDILNNDGALPPSVNQNINSTLATHDVLGTYLGLSLTVPTGTFVVGDTFLYNGDTSGNYVNGFMYRWNGAMWKKLNPTDAENYKYYMQSLNDVMSISNAGSGAFTTLFANILMSNNAIIGKLQTQVLELQDGGTIKTANLHKGTTVIQYLDSELEEWLTSTTNCAGIRVSVDGGESFAYTYENGSKKIAQTVSKQWTVYYRLSNDSDATVNPDRYLKLTASIDLSSTEYRYLHLCYYTQIASSLTYDTFVSIDLDLSKGFELLHTGESTFYGDMNVDGVMRIGGNLDVQGVAHLGRNTYLDGFLNTNNVPFQPLCACHFIYRNSRLRIIASKNISSITVDSTGWFTLTLKKAIKLKYYNDNVFGDEVSIYLAGQSVYGGYHQPLIMRPLTINTASGYTKQGEYMLVDKISVIFTDPQNNENQNPDFAQILAFGTDTN